MSDSGNMSNPFVGLRPFERDESMLFFGRREQTIELLEKLHDTHFVGVVGSSGCGKSSLIRAGLVPKLLAGFLVAERDRWLIATTKPGAGPVQNLASAMVAAATGESKGPAEELREAVRDRGAESVLDYLEPALSGADASLLLLVDQFEEIFRFQKAGTDAAARRNEAAEFVEAVLNLALQRRLPVYVVLTMRSDFLGDCDQFPGLPEALNRGQYLVPRLTRAQRRQCIEGPVHLYGEEIAPQLVDRVLNDAGEEADQLPVLQHAMMRTWTRWHAEGGTGRIDRSHYEAVGTTHHALSLHAEEALESLATESRSLAKRVFQALTDTDAQNRSVRRPAFLSELVQSTSTPATHITEIVKRFREGGRSFLVAYRDADKGDALIDISHESLIRKWERLGRWVDEEARAATFYVRLAEDAREYEEEHGPLRKGTRLRFTEEWLKEFQPTEGWARRYHPGYSKALAFVRKSAAVRTKEERERVRVRRRKLWTNLGLGGAVVAVIALSLWAARAGDRLGETSAALAVADAALARANSLRLVAEARRDSALSQQIADAVSLSRERARADSLDAVNQIANQQLLGVGQSLLNISDEVPEEFTRTFPAFAPAMRVVDARQADPDGFEYLAIPLGFAASFITNKQNSDAYVLARDSIAVLHREIRSLTDSLATLTGCGALKVPGPALQESVESSKWTIVEVRGTGPFCSDANRLEVGGTIRDGDRILLLSGRLVLVEVEDEGAVTQTQVLLGHTKGQSSLPQALYMRRGNTLRVLQGVAVIYGDLIIELEEGGSYRFTPG